MLRNTTQHAAMRRNHPNLVRSIHQLAFGTPTSKRQVHQAIVVGSASPLRIMKQQQQQRDAAGYSFKHQQFLRFHTTSNKKSEGTTATFVPISRSMQIPFWLNCHPSAPIPVGWIDMGVAKEDEDDMENILMEEEEQLKMMEEEESLSMTTSSNENLGLMNRNARRAKKSKWW